MKRTEKKANQYVLVVDDDPVIRQAFLRILQQGGYQVNTASDGESGLASAFDSQPDIIFLDLMLPGIDGFQVLSQLRDSPTTKHIPVIIVTAKANVSTLIRAIDLGADDFIAKPFMNSDVLRKLKFAQMPGKEKEKVIHDTLSQSTASAEESSYVRMREYFILNFESIYLYMLKLAFYHNDEELKEIISRFLDLIRYFGFKNMKENVLQMLGAISAHNWDKAIEILETIYHTFQDLRKTIPNAS